MKPGDQSKLLSDAELDALEDFLLNRPEPEDYDEDDESVDDGIICLSELDGFFAALASGPNTVMPSLWLPLVWGDRDPIWESLEEAQKWIGLVMRYYNEVVGAMNADPDGFQPCYEERTTKGKTYLIVDSWCEGYLRGMSVDEGWAEMNKEARHHLSLIMAFTGVGNWIAHKREDPSETELLKQRVASSASWLYKYWLGRRREFLGRSGFSGSPADSQNRVGANDPCPCGSGLKYKKCCRGN